MVLTKKITIQKIFFPLFVLNVYKAVGRDYRRMYEIELSACIYIVFVIYRCKYVLEHSYQ